MSDAFEIDVRRVLERRMAEAPVAHSWSEVERRAADPERPVSPQDRRKTQVVWLTIAAATILAVAGAMLFLRDDNGSVVIDEVPLTTVGEPADPVIEDVEPDVVSDPDTDAEATPESVTVAAGDLEVTWVHTRWDSDEGPPTDNFHRLGATPSGVLSLDHDYVIRGEGFEAGEFDRVWQWTASTGWVPVSQLDDVSVGYFVNGRDFVIAIGGRQSDGRVALRSFDGEVWTELDISADPRPLTATSPSGLSVVGDGPSDDAPAVIRADGVVDVFEPPWPQVIDLNNCCALHEVIDFPGGSVIFRSYQGDDGLTVHEAWKYLGDGQFTGPGAVPAGEHIAWGPNGVAMRVEWEGDEQEIGSLMNLLATTDGIDWAVRDSLPTETMLGYQVLGGDSFWIRGPRLKGSTDTIEVRSSVSLSSDGEEWVPLDLPFAGLGKILEVSGDHIVVFEVSPSNPSEMWIGSVTTRDSAGEATDTTMP